MIKKLLGALALSLTCMVTFAAEGGYQMDRAPDRINDLAALQNGAKLFVNYCLNCHSASSMRYNKLTDIGLTEEEIKKNLLFTSDKIGALMTIAMTPADAKKWLGAPPPDLSVIARAKSTNLGPSGVDYLYTYLRTFYRDTSKPTGWDNLAFPSVGMPNVLWQLEGPRAMTRTQIQEVAAEGDASKWVRTTTAYDADGFSVVKTEDLQGYKGPESTRTAFEAPDIKHYHAFESNVADLSNFLGWMAEPNQLERKQIGVWVLLFLFLFLFVTLRLNASYWKHVR